MDAQEITSERFAFEVIRNLGNSVRALDHTVRDMRSNLTKVQEQNVEVLSKLADLEINSVVTRLTKLEIEFKRIETENLKSAGVKDAFTWFFQSPLIMWLAGAMVAFYVWVTNNLPAK